MTLSKSTTTISLTLHHYRSAETAHPRKPGNGAGPDPYGNMTTRTGSERLRNPFRFSSKYTDDETDLIYYGFRYYSPEMGRWLSKDPLGDAAFFHRFTHGMRSRDRARWGRYAVAPAYVFIDNSPICYVDEFGLKHGNPVYGPGDPVYPGGPIGPGDPVSPANPYDPGGPYDPWPVTPPMGDLPPFFVGIDANWGVGFGVTLVSWCGADDYLHHQIFVKGCAGPAFGAALQAGPVLGLSDCPTGEEVRERYSGYFLEIGGAYWLGFGVDIGLDGPFWPPPIESPRPPSGIVEGGPIIGTPGIYVTPISAP